MKRSLIFILYCLFIFLIIILADLNKLPLHFFMRIPHYDWVAHMILYGLFYGLLEYFLKGKRISIRRYNISLAFLITSILITGEEISQIFFPSRTFSLMDLFMGFLGMYLWNHRRRIKLPFRKTLR